MKKKSFIKKWCSMAYPTEYREDLNEVIQRQIEKALKFHGIPKDCNNDYPFKELKEAHANGAEIEFYHPDHEYWYTIKYPRWDQNVQYRIKPKQEIKPTQEPIQSKLIKGGYRKLLNHDDEIIVRVGYIAKDFIVADYYYNTVTREGVRDFIVYLDTKSMVSDPTQEEMNQMMADCPEWFNNGLQGCTRSCWD